MCILFVVFGRPDSINLPVCVDYMVYMFGIEAPIIALYCILLFNGLLPCSRWIFSSDSNMAMDCVDLVVYYVLILYGCIFFGMSSLLSIGPICHILYNLPPILLVLFAWYL